MKNLVIIGAGPAGLTCSIYAARAGISPVVIAGDLPGGQLVKTDIVENYPGFEEIKGADLMMKILSHAESLGSQMIYDSVVGIKKIDQGFEISMASSDVIIAKSVLIATGAKHRHLDVPGEAEFTNKGVSWCATCDGPMYRGKRVAVVGGGNTAVMEALFLANFAEKVYLIHRRGALRAEQSMQDRLFGNSKIECLWNSSVKEIHGSSMLEKVSIQNEEGVYLLNIDGLFIAVGTIPASSFIDGILEKDDEGYIKTDERLMTSCKGIFAAGDVVSNSLKQAVFSAGQGCLASKSIEEYLGFR